MNREGKIEINFIEKLTDLKYTYREDIHDRDALEPNFREKLELLNRVKLSDAEFSRLLEEIINPDVFASSKMLREINTFIREDGTPLQYMLVNIKDWCKNDYEVVNQLRINTNNSHHRYDVILLINGLDMVYFYHYMFIVDEWCKKNINMGGFASVNMTGFKKLLVPRPKPAEQQRMADYLSSVDELISAEIDKLDQLKAHKKGLMQQLFPSI